MIHELFRLRGPRGANEGASAAGAGEAGKTGDPAKTGAGEGKPNGADPTAAGGGDLDARLAALESRNRELTDELRRVNGEAASKRKALEQYGSITPERAAELASLADKQEQHDRESRGQYEAQLKVEREKIAAAESKATRIEQELCDSMMERDIVAAVTAHRPMPHSMKPVVEGGSPMIVETLRKVFRYDRASKKTLHVSLMNEDGTPMTVEQFVAKERTGLLGVFFESDAKGGAGGLGGEPPGGEAGAVKISRTLDPMKRQAAYEEAKKAGKKIVFTD